MKEQQYEFPLPLGTVIQGGVKPYGKKEEHYQYHIEEVLGQGSFGITYKVWVSVKIGNATSKAYFAVKEHFVKGRCHRAVDGVTVEYPVETARDVEESLKDFISEGRLLRAICKVKNPDDPDNDGWRHVVPVNEVVEANNTAYFVMEYLDGGSIREKVPAGGIDEQVAMTFMKPICRAVSYIHRNKILHLDIKPDNIVMRRNPATAVEEPVLIDFGVSYHFDSQGKLTSTHTTLGHSDGFSPIEQYSVIDTFQTKVDVYALGATFFYLLTGKEPPKSVNVKVDTIASLLPSTVSERTRAAIVHAMAKDSDYRTPTVERFMEELAESITLPVGFKLKGAAASYFVAETIEVNPGYIEYSCMTDEKEAKVCSNTKILAFRLLERFDKELHGRAADLSVVGADDKSGGDTFFHEVRRTMGMTEVGEWHMNGERVERELFHDNGTLYAVCDIRYRPERSWSKICRRIRQGIRQLFATIGKAFNSLAKHGRRALKPLLSILCITLVAFGLYNLWPTVIGWLHDETPRTPFSPDTVSLRNHPFDTPTVHAEVATTENEQSSPAERTSQTSQSSVVQQPSSPSAPAQQPSTPSPLPQQPSTPSPQLQQPSTPSPQVQQPSAPSPAQQQEDVAALAVKYANMDGAENSAKALQYALKADDATRARVISKLKAKGYPPAMAY